MNVLFRLEAEQEFIETVNWYESQRNGLGDAFAAAVRETVDPCLWAPASGRLGRAGTRSLQVTGFPYRMVYRIEPQVLRVFALAHARRRPGYWIGRLAD